MSNSSILIVEDDKINSQMIIEYVSSMGYRVSGVADNYNKALESVKSDAPDLILMDIILKGSKDGVSIFNAIRASYDIIIINTYNNLKFSVINNCFINKTMHLASKFILQTKESLNYMNKVVCSVPF